MRSLKVLLVHKFWKKVGGAEVYFQDTARILRNHGHDVHIYTTEYDAQGAQDVFERNDKVHFGTSYDYLQGGLVRKLTNIPNVIYSKTNKEEFRKLIREIRPDIVHVFAIYITITPSILDACREEGVPVVMSCNDYKHICPNYRLFHHGKICEDCKGGRFYNAFLNNCCKHSFAVSAISMIEAYVHDTRNIWKKNIHAFLFESEFMMKKTEEFWGKDAARLKFLGKPFNATRWNAEYRDEGYVLYLGRLSDEKGVDILLKAMKEVPECKLKIVGDGEYRPVLEAMKSEHELVNVEFTGPKHGEELEQLFAGCRFVVVPSIWHENFPYVMMEAYARGKAVVGSDKGGIPEYIEEGKTGFVFPSHDPIQLASIISKLWHDPSLAKQLGHNAKSFADRDFNDSAFYNRLLEIYQSATGEVS
ncbi:MAG: hypothetical protein RL090_338 [Bacteroidota bacterium]